MESIGKPMETTGFKTFHTLNPMTTIEHQWIQSISHTTSHGSHSKSHESHFWFCCRLFGVNICSWIQRLINANLALINSCGTYFTAIQLHFLSSIIYPISMLLTNSGSYLGHHMQLGKLAATLRAQACKRHADAKILGQLREATGKGRDGRGEAN